MDFFIDLLLLVLVLAALVLTYLILWHHWTLKKIPEFSQHGELEELADGSWRRTIKCKSWKQVAVKLTWEFQQLEFQSAIPPRVQCIFKSKSLGTLVPGEQSAINKELERLGPPQYVPWARAKNIPLDFKLIEPSEEEIERDVEIEIGYRLDWFDAEGREGSWTVDRNYVKFQPPSRRMPKPKDTPSANEKSEDAKKEKDYEGYARKKDLQEALAKIDELDNRLKQAEGRRQRQPAPDEPGGGSETSASALLPSVVGLRPERALLKLVNWWWQNPQVKRKTFAEQLALSAPNIEFYDMKGVIDNLSNLSESAYGFEPRPREGGWLWVSVGPSEFCTVPAVKKFFQIGEAISILRRMFKGIGEVPPDFKFDKVEKACRLRRVASQKSKYTIVGHGRLTLKTADGRPLHAEPSPVDPAAVSLLHSEASTRQIRDVEASVERLKTQLSSLQKSVKPPGTSESRADLGGLRKELRDYVGSELQGVRLSVQGVQGVVSKLQESQENLAKGQKSVAERLHGLAAQIDSRVPRVDENLAGRVESFEGTLGGFRKRLDDLASTLQSVEGSIKDLRSLDWVVRASARDAVTRSAPPTTEPAALEIAPQDDALPVETSDAAEPSAPDLSEKRPDRRSDLEVPGGWKESLAAAIAEGPPSAQDPYVGHLLRLRFLEKHVRERVAAGDSTWSVDIVHVSLTLSSEKIKVSSAIVEEREGGTGFDVRAGGSITRTIYGQLFLLLSKAGNEGQRFLSLAPGEFDDSLFRRGYEQVVHRLPGKLVRINDIKPARLERQRDQNTYYVEDKMIISY